MTMTRDSREGDQIRGTHPYSYRAGKWAVIRATVDDPGTGRWCYLVEFPDGATDFWAVDNPLASYEFRPHYAVIMLANQLACESCGQSRRDVLVREDPYQADVHGESVIVRICDDCDEQRRLDI